MQPFARDALCGFRDIEIPFQHIEEWAQAAVPALEDVAAVHGSHITYKDPAARTFNSTGIYARMLLQDMSARLLNRVSHLRQEGELPAPSSLVANVSHRMVGSGFDEVLHVSNRPVARTERACTVQPSQLSAIAEFPGSDCSAADWPKATQEGYAPRMAGRTQSAIAPLLTALSEQG